VMPLASTLSGPAGMAEILQESPAWLRTLTAVPR
jgi:hypothetical protein